MEHLAICILEQEIHADRANFLKWQVLKIFFLLYYQNGAQTDEKENKHLSIDSFYSQC